MIVQLHRLIVYSTRPEAPGGPTLGQQRGAAGGGGPRVGRAQQPDLQPVPLRAPGPQLRVFLGTDLPLFDVT